jgi:hypothetical protein
MAMMVMVIVVLVIMMVMSTLTVIMRWALGTMHPESQGP